MKIAIITEGISEFKSLSLLYMQLYAKMPANWQVLTPLRVNVTPDAPIPQVARACKPVLVAVARSADRVLVLLDREQQDECSGDIAKAVEHRLSGIVSVPVAVVIKNRTYENWMISDLGALRSCPGRFSVTNRLEQRVLPNKADNVDAYTELKRVALDGQYDKIRDSLQICRAAKVEAMAGNSRSFRHFLHLLQYGPYRSQCRLPARPRGRRTRGGRRS